MSEQNLPSGGDTAEVPGTQQLENVPAFDDLGVDDVSAQVMHIIQNINKSLGDRPGRHLLSR
ncbi:hypothetical protein PIB30_050541 [Stylosanthes scabra]|uniref:Uncharacterized protein n=1 Tax=Stylosanthes scabra TaxID=79078 RepID=A0ABU6XG56_9FABA|nr:hypothetical protein [Stylosanthes scabra]